MQISPTVVSSVNSLSPSDASTQRIKAALQVTQTDLQSNKDMMGNPIADGNWTHNAVDDYGNMIFNLGGGKGINAEDVVKIADLAIKEAGNQLNSAFVAAGITTSPPVEIKFDNQGNPLIGDHPQKDKIIALFKGNPDLTDTLFKANNIKELSVTMQEGGIYSSAYSQAYARGGSSAADAVYNKFAYMSKPDTNLLFGNKGLEILYNGKTVGQYLQQLASSVGLGSGAIVNGFA